MRITARERSRAVAIEHGDRQLGRQAGAEDDRQERHQKQRQERS